MKGVAGTIRAGHNDVAIHGMYEVTKLLTTAAPRERVLPELLSMLCHFFELSDAGIALGNADGEPELIRAVGRAAQSDAHWRLLLHEANRRAHGAQLPWVVESERSDPTFHDESLRCRDTDLDRSLVAVPIRDHRQVQGVLGIERLHSPGDQAGFCFDDDIKVLTAIANMIAVSAPARGRLVVPDSPPGASDGSTELEAARASSIVGEHPRWRAVLQRGRTVARRSSTVLLRGESGTGKEVLARFIHTESPRRERPFVAVNCSALSETLLESELFGHEKGAFTGAHAQRKGRFELAHGGSLFLDEIGEISPAFQVRLLRAVQLGEFERVGGTTTIKVDVRLIAATHRNLEEEVREGRFRADLYYRLSVVPLFLPALRERSTDIAGLAQAFLERFNAANDSDFAFHASALQALSSYAFPGNVRELENTVCRAATLATRRVLTAQDFAWLKDEQGIAAAVSRLHDEASSQQGDDFSEGFEGDDESCDTPRERLLAAMERAGWVQAKAARLLGLSPRQIGYALRKHRIPIRRL